MTIFAVLLTSAFTWREFEFEWVEASPPKLDDVEMGRVESGVVRDDTSAGDSTDGEESPRGGQRADSEQPQQHAHATHGE
ncbi:hypothetical protein Pmar_PMAR024339 [Perkinsus marinus ATCC 50983]|uniref:Uncharacterized protein n=1 Tax=Perkinsus marinus (strain ATCC 50983 / TXsc) TaxID=423536 RepID=C5LMK4_PERM5|nr:hypothetical protein Pmar_PMAR024339 [Perkinsus marinus ATCC 50983]EER02021.1 hypothetical protein Pmar_PMAR024339 [Perkinsus marinus ATCC 50983]|eukprot:XP_002769303.1 hypothetical protein Pmar_PMAR024339 [Perkinsus marinus ATCC 50983]